MKERFLNVLKWFFIILGVLFLMQILLVAGAFIGLSSFLIYTFFTSLKFIFFSKFFLKHH